MQFEAYVLHHLSRIKMLYLQHHRRILRYGARCLRVLIDYTAYHHIDDIVLCALLRYQRPYIASVTHHRYPVRNHLDLIHSVGDIHNSQLLLSQIPNDLEQLFYFRLR